MCQVQNLVAQQLLDDAKKLMFLPSEQHRHRRVRSAGAADSSVTEAA